MVVEHAVAQAILAHPILQVGIKGEETKDPYFVYLPSLDLSQIVRWETVHHATNRDDALQRILEKRHSTLWPNIGQQPGYEVIVLRSDSGVSSTKDEGAVVDIVFAWHHAMADGTSGAIFQRTLLDALNKPAPLSSFSPSTHILTLNRMELLPPQEALINFSVSWPFFFKTLWTTFAPSFLRPSAEKFWTGAPITSEKISTRLRLFTFSPAITSAILAQTKKHSTTPTPLLHILVAQSLANRVPEAIGAGFKSTTPISLRRLVPPSSNINPDTALANIITAADHTFPASTINKLRSNHTDEEQIWALTAVLGAELKAKVASLPGDDMVGLLSWITDHHKRLLDKVGKPRETTWEISNVGAVDMAGSEGEWKVDRMVFSQSGSVAGLALNVNVVAVKGAELAVTLTWQKGILEEDVVAGVAKDLERWLTRLAETGEFGLGQ